jgi:hypothetical protein
MRRLYVVAALAAVLGVVPLFGQMRGGHFGSSFGRGFSSSRNFGFSGGFNRGGFNRGFYGRGYGYGFNRGGFGYGRGTRFFGGRRPYFGRGRFYGVNRVFWGGSFYWGPDYYPYYGYPYVYSTPVVAVPPTYYYRDDDYDRGDLRRDIDELNGKVDHLRRDIESRNYVPRPPSRQEAVRESTTLVFKDKHREEVQNYAVVGNSLWILDETKASKVPLDDLDLDTTKRVNEDRGIDFDVRK